RAPTCTPSTRSVRSTSSNGLDRRNRCAYPGVLLFEEDPMRFLSIALALPSVALAAPAELRPKSRVDEVTVYLSSARVTRSAKMDLPAGDARVLFEGLPPELVDDSLRLQGAGSARAKVFGAEVEVQPHVEAM